MIPKSDAMAAPASAREFDQEIVDMASYIHQYKVDSDLAVSTACCHILAIIISIDTLTD